MRTPPPWLPPSRPRLRVGKRDPTPNPPELSIAEDLEGYVELLRAEEKGELCPAPVFTATQDGTVHVETVWDARLRARASSTESELPQNVPSPRLPEGRSGHLIAAERAQARADASIRRRYPEMAARERRERRMRARGRDHLPGTSAATDK